MLTIGKFESCRRPFESQAEIDRIQDALNGIVIYNTDGFRIYYSRIQRYEDDSTHLTSYIDIQSLKRIRQIVAENLTERLSELRQQQDKFFDEHIKL